MTSSALARGSILASIAALVLGTVGCGGSSSDSGGTVSGNLVSIALTPAQGVVTAGQTLQMRAVGTYEVGSKDITGEVAWTSSVSGAATVGAASGLVTGAASPAFGVNLTSITASAVTPAATLVTASTPVSTCAVNLPDPVGSACGNIAISPSVGVAPGATVTVTVNQGSGALCGGGFRMSMSAPGVFVSAPGGTINGQGVTYAALPSGSVTRTATYRLSSTAADWATFSKCPQSATSPTGILMTNGPWVSAGTDLYGVAAPFSVGY